MILVEVLERLIDATSFQIQGRKQDQGAGKFRIDLHDILQGRLRIVKFSFRDVGTSQIKSRFGRFGMNFVTLLKWRDGVRGLPSVKKNPAFQSPALPSLGDCS